MSPGRESELNKIADSEVQAHTEYRKMGPPPEYLDTEMDYGRQTEVNQHLDTERSEFRQIRASDFLETDMKTSDAQDISESEDLQDQPS